MTQTQPFPTLGHEQRAHLWERLKTIELEDADILFRAGDPGNGCYFIERGSLRLEISTAEVDTETTLGHVETGDVLGELSLIDGRERSATAIAEGPAVVKWLTLDALRELENEQPALGNAIWRILALSAAQRLRTTNDRLLEHLEDSRPTPEVDQVVASARRSQLAILGWSEERMDQLLFALAQSVAAQAKPLALATVKETHLGNVADKTTKNLIASMAVLQSLAGRPSIGEKHRDEALGITEFGGPVGVVFALVPITNPVATAIFKTLIALKSRNAIILSFHRGCRLVGKEVTDLIRATLESQGAPADLVQMVQGKASRRTTARYMAHDGVDLVLATGGAAMVKAAYSSGTPTIGVGSGNTPTWISATADPQEAAFAIVASKSFDNGLICGAEHNLIVDVSISAAFKTALEAAGAAVLNSKEAAFAAQALVTDQGFRPEMIGRSAAEIAGALRIERPHPIALLILPGVPDMGTPWTGEKLAPVLSYFEVNGEAEAHALALTLLGKQGAGHTAIVHTTDPAVAARFANALPVSRILWNSPGTQGVSGVTTSLMPSFTLGCGTYGGTSTTDNVSFEHLLNIKRLAKFHPPSEALLKAVTATPE